MVPTAIAFGILMALGEAVIARVVSTSGDPLPNARPAYEDRTFHSEAVDTYIDKLVPQVRTAGAGLIGGCHDLIVVDILVAVSADCKPGPGHALQQLPA